MDRAFQKDDRVRLSAKGRRVHHRSPPDRLGTVATEPLSAVRISVCWDGKTKGRCSYHHTMLTRINKDFNDAAT